MITRVFQPKDFAMLCQWWRGHGQQGIPVSWLSDFGMVVEDADIPLAAAWLYLTTSKIAWIECATTNPDVSMRTRVRGLEYLIGCLLKEAKGFGAEIVTSNMKSKGLSRMVSRLGFQQGDSGLTNMVHKLWQ